MAKYSRYDVRNKKANKHKNLVKSGIQGRRIKDPVLLKRQKYKTEMVLEYEEKVQTYPSRSWV